MSIDGDEDFLFPAMYTPPLLLAKALEHHLIASLSPAALRKSSKTGATAPADRAYVRRRRMQHALRVTVCAIFTA
jgi:hypothetical protein